MPRKTKEQKEIDNKAKILEEKPSTKNTTKKSTTTKKSSTKNATATKKKENASTTTKTKKKVTTKKPATKKAVTKKTTTKKSTAKKATSYKKKGEIVEYYDLPYRYNQTIVKVLAQTPTNLFIYWDIADKDRKNFKEQYGDNFFETTKPILIIYNDTLNYSFEIEINDFANSWYLHVADSKCDYRIELGRRPIVKTKKINTDYIYITTSNKIEAPNDRILFDNQQKMVYFKNVKTGQLNRKTLSSISFIQNVGKIYNIYDLYKAIYQDEPIEEIFDLSNPSSSNPSSGSFSSRFL